LNTIILDAEWRGKLYFWLLQNGKIIKTPIRTEHKPYLLARKLPEKLPSYVQKIERVEKYVAIEDTRKTFYKLTVPDPKFIYDSKTNSGLRTIIDGWEDKIRYHHCFMYDHNLIFSLPYTYINNRLESKIEIQPPTELLSSEPLKNEFLKFYYNLFMQPIPEIPFCCLDIEVNSEGLRDGEIPDPKKADREITAISFYYHNGNNFVFLYDYKKTGQKGWWKLFLREKTMLEATFDLLYNFAVWVSFIGYEFDLQYLKNRAL
jgi:DNA polymerase I